jgi:hypothetical protein
VQSRRPILRQGKRDAGATDHDSQGFFEKCALNSLAKKFNDHVANQSGNDGNHEIGNCENILNSENQALSSVIGMSEFPHQKI